MVSRYLAQQGWDWVILDMQHGSFNFETAYECIHTIRTAGARPIARVSIGGFSDIQKVLDLGASGIIVPMVNSRNEAEKAAQAAKYPPLGSRSIGGDPWYHYGASYPERANEETLLLVQIEHINAVRAVDQILSVEGVDGCFMGQVDLALSMGLSHVNFRNNPDHQAAIRGTVEICRALGKLACYNAYSVAEAQERVRQGFACITLRSDVDLFMNTTQQLLADLRGHFVGEAQAEPSESSQATPQRRKA
jgi:4-hydroxy-2-oxoheptanedioate aldolase